jgi:phosphatidylinositol kinase/protein kinase (PI-3  family)
MIIVKVHDLCMHTRRRIIFLCSRRVYRSMSASSEAYYRLRCEFATSHAQLSISHYILGIGDRHLSNFMLDLQTGSIIGIDFGHAFGSATQVCSCVSMAAADLLFCSQDCLIMPGCLI